MLAPDTKTNFIGDTNLHLWIGWNNRMEKYQAHGYDSIFRIAQEKIAELSQSPNFTVSLLLVGRGERSHRAFRLWDGLPFPSPGAWHRFHDPQGYADLIHKARP